MRRAAADTDCREPQQSRVQSGGGEALLANFFEGSLEFLDHFRLIFGKIVPLGEGGLEVVEFGGRV